MGWIRLDVPLAAGLFTARAAGCVWLVRACARNRG
jgi:hypothetical protein